MEWMRIFEDWGLDLTLDSLVLCGFVVTVLLGFYVAKAFLWRHFLAKKDNVIVHMFRRFSGPAQVLVLLTAAIIILNTLIIDVEQQYWYQKSYAILIVGVLAWAAVKGVGFFSDLILGRIEGEENTLKGRSIRTQVRVLRRLAVAMIVLIAIASALMVFEQIRSLGVSLIASAGLAGIIIGLAAQKTLGNFFTGLQIAITQPIRLGDAVIVEGEWGNIEEINLTYVVVRIWDWRRMILPISYFVDKPFQNWTRTTAELIGSVYLYVDYTLPIEPLRAELDRILKEEDVAKLWDANVKVIQVVDTNDKVMSLRVLVSAQDAPTAWDLRCAVRERLISFIQREYPNHLPLVRADSPPKCGEGDKLQGAAIAEEGM